MSITLDTITLPNDLEWVDEFQWSYVKQSYKITCGGQVVIEERKLINGRPITLAGDFKYGVITRSVLESLQAKVNTKGDVMTLTLHDGRVFSVMWRRESQPMIAIPIDITPSPTSGTLYKLQLNLVEV